MAITLSSVYIEKHPYFKARKDAYKTQSGKLVDPYYVVELPTAVVGMGVTGKGEIIFVKQYRHPVGETILELPGGFVNDNEPPHDAVLRELKEETGYTFQYCHSLGVTALNPGILNNYTHLFIATGGNKTAAQELDPHEEIEIVTFSIEDVKSMLLQNQIKQSAHALALFMGFEYLKRENINFG